MITLQIENDRLPLGVVNQVSAVVRAAMAARLTAEDQIEYCYVELGKILALSPARKYNVTRGGHHVALIAAGYPHARQAIILEGQL